ncbi:hypothetical protein M3223_20970 [Paenibacillus pasadenensis]|nr:hypothetical protein [Paenibacillus pasadenensis]
MSKDLPPLLIDGVPNKPNRYKCQFDDAAGLGYKTGSMIAIADPLFLT